MEIAIGVFFLAVIGGAILLFFGLVIFLIRRKAKRRNSNQSRNFVGNSATNRDDFYDDSANYRGNSGYTDSSVILPAAAGAIVGEQIASNYQENQSVGGSWEYTNYENTDNSNADSGTDGNSSSSDSSSDSGSSSSCSSCGGGGD